VDERIHLTVHACGGLGPRARRFTIEKVGGARIFSKVNTWVGRRDVFCIPRASGKMPAGPVLARSMKWGNKFAKQQGLKESKNA